MLRLERLKSRSLNDIRKLRKLYCTIAKRRDKQNALASFSFDEFTQNQIRAIALNIQILYGCSVGLDEILARFNGIAH